jgi:hypothetical protein
MNEAVAREEEKNFLKTTTKEDYVMLDQQLSYRSKKRLRIPDLHCG